VKNTIDISSIFQRSGCLSETGLQRYIDHNLNDDAKHKVEEHLNGCPLCSDAMEGYVLIPELKKDKYFLNTVRSTLTKRYRIEKQYRRTRNLSFLMSAAAIVVIFIGIFVLYVHLTKQTLNTTAYESHKSTIPQTDSVENIVQKEQESGVENTTGNNTETKQKKKNIPPPNNNMVVVENRMEKDNYSQGASSESNLKTTDTLTNNQSLVVSKEIVANNDLFADENTLQDRVVSESEYKKESIKEEVLANDDNKDDNRKLFNKNKRAAKISTMSESVSGGVNAPAMAYDSVVTNLSAVVVDNYLIGMEFYRKHDFKNAILNFEKIVNDNTHPNYYSGLWYSAKSQIKLNQKSEAKKTLKKLIAEPNLYKDSAQSEMEKLKK